MIVIVMFLAYMFGNSLSNLNGWRV